jgi:DNA-binding CsgD family transcriptional regulator
MFTMPVSMVALAAAASGGQRAAPAVAPAEHLGSQPAALLARWLAPALDHVGRGMLLVTQTGRVLHANRPAQLALGDAQAPLQIEHGHLRGRTPAESLPLAEALASAGVRGLRRLLTLGPREQALTVAVLPLDGSSTGDDTDDDGAPRAVLVSLPQSRKAAPMQDLALSCFGRQCGFTAAETAVLQALVEGRMPSDIARAKGVQLSTVRTQIGQLRLKTGARSIRDLLERVATLPPMMALVN